MIVTRRYTILGPTDKELQDTVSADTLNVGAFSGTIDIQTDNALSGGVETLDELMLQKGYVFKEQNPPKSTDLILCAPNGGKYQITVDDAGILKTTLM